MKKAEFIIDKSYEKGEIDTRIFSSFVEHLGRCVYTGIYEPDHKEADDQGFRKDVIELTKGLNLQLIRYPGGNFVSNYDFRDGIGPLDLRPKRLDLAWKTLETNKVGIDEFIDWCKKSNTKPMAAVNLGTGTPKDAGYFVEYCNFPGNTQYSDLRIKNGHKDPHNIKVWCLGNEMDGPWQIGQLSAYDYGKKAREAAKIMKLVDPSIELVLCGSSNINMPTFPEWDRIVLEHAYENVEYISMHNYYENQGDDLDFLASYASMDEFINSVIATADYVKAVKRSNKKMMISFDEWNIWYQKDTKLPDWDIAPKVIEDQYNLIDALTFGGLLCTLINHADRIKISCLAQLCNVIAPILTKKGGPAIKQTIYYPFEMAANFCKGTLLTPIVNAPKVETSTKGEVSSLCHTVTFNKEENELTILVLNLLKEDMMVNFDLRSFEEAAIIEHKIIEGNDLKVINTFDNPYAVVPSNLSFNNDNSTKKEICIHGQSFNMIRIKL